MRPDTPRGHRLVRGTIGAGFVLGIGAIVGGSAAFAGVTVPYVETSSIQLAPGITHARGTMRTAGDRIQAVQVGTIDLKNPQVRLRALLSNDRVVELERPSLNADRNSRPGSLAMIATNGDVSVRGLTGASAAPHSLHIQDGEVMVAPECARPTLGIDADGTARIGMVRIQMRLDMGAARKGWHSWVRIAGTNTPRVNNEIILYTPRFGPTTLTSPDGVEVVLSVAQKLRPTGRMSAQVVEVRAGSGNGALQPGQMILSANGTMRSELLSLSSGLEVFIDSVMLSGERASCGPPAAVTHDWDNVVEAIGGNYFVARRGGNGAPSAGQYYKGAVAAPRTSVGLTADGRALMVVVDGRQAGYSVGVTLAEMGELMLQLGAVDAFNLDGGGSTIMAVRQPGADHITVSDRPSDGRERALTQALAAFSVTP